MQKVPQSEPNIQAGRMMAATVAEDRAKRLRKRAKAFEILAGMIDHAIDHDLISKEDEECLWGLLVDQRFGP